jgi:hypothetical protein
MNVTPKCECNRAPFGLAVFGYDDPCPMDADIVIVIKTLGKIYYVSLECLEKYTFHRFISKEHTYSIFPAKDYSRPKSERCIRCDGPMMSASIRDKVVGFPNMGSKVTEERKLKPKNYMVCKECGWKEGSNVQDK